MTRPARQLSFGALIAIACIAAPSAAQNIAIRGKTLHTMAGEPIADGVVIIRDGKIAAVGPAAATPVPEGFQTLTAAVVVPGLIDAHCTVGFSGLLNIPHDQDQLERSAPVQPELRAIDAYNCRDPLVEWIRNFGITTIHTGHAPGELISGQTLIVKTTGNTVADAVIVPSAAVAATLSPMAHRSERQAPGTRGKAMAMLRQEFIKAQEYVRKQSNEDEEKRPARDLKFDVLSRVLARELPLMVTANRAQDIASVLRLASEFNIRVWLDSAAESYLLIDEIKAAGVPVILHPPLVRAWGDYENMSFETASKLVAAGIPVALQAGYESYVPKTRVVLFEAAIAAANGLSFEQALATITSDAAGILGVADRVGSLDVGKDGDVALFDGDPFEYTTHCVGVVIDGRVVSEKPR